MTADRSFLLITLVAGMLLLVATAALLLLRHGERQALEARLDRVAGDQRRGGAAAPAPSSAFTGFLHALGIAIRTRTRFYSEDDLAVLEGALRASGLRPKNALPVVLGTKVLALLLVPVAAMACGVALDLPRQTLMIVLVVSLTVGVLGPELALRMLRRSYVKALTRGASDALDLLVVCTEAGMGLDNALEHVSREIAYSNQAMASALVRLLEELRLLPDRRQALNNFGQRSGVPALQRTATILVQTLQYGSPLGQALRVVASELRRERMLRLEERAVRLPALLVFPLICFILPSLFIVLGASSFLHLGDILRSLGGHRSGG